MKQKKFTFVATSIAMLAFVVASSANAVPINYINCDFVKGDKKYLDQTPACRLELNCDVQEGARTYKKPEVAWCPFNDLAKNECLSALKCIADTTFDADVMKEKATDQPGGVVRIGPTAGAGVPPCSPSGGPPAGGRGVTR